MTRFIQYDIVYACLCHSVRTPLEATYMQSWAGVPQRWQRVIDA
jgi:hypothetical protein